MEMGISRRTTAVGEEHRAAFALTLQCWQPFIDHAGGKIRIDREAKNNTMAILGGKYATPRIG